MGVLFYLCNRIGRSSVFFMIYPHRFTGMCSRDPKMSKVYHIYHENFYRQEATFLITVGFIPIMNHLHTFFIYDSNMHIWNHTTPQLFNAYSKRLARYSLFLKNHILTLRFLNLSYKYNNYHIIIIFTKTKDVLLWSCSFPLSRSSLCGILLNTFRIYILNNITNPSIIIVCSRQLMTNKFCLVLKFHNLPCQVNIVSLVIKVIGEVYIN